MRFFRANRKVRVQKTSLPIEQAVYVPSTKQGDKPITKKAFSRRVASVERYLSDRYGGFTEVQHFGGYYDSSRKKIVGEQGARVVAFATKKAYREHKPEMHRKLLSWQRKWGQSSIGYEVEGDMFYLSQKRKTPMPQQRAKPRRARQPVSLLSRPLRLGF